MSKADLTKKQKSNALPVDTTSLRLDWCSHAAAKYAVEHWHYSKVLPTPPYVRCGVWENGRYIGVVLFSRGATQHIAKPFGVQQTEICELTRVALTTHNAPVSRIVSIALKLLRQNSPGIRLVISFADPGHGHVGGIYQAGGWTYLGKQSETVEFVAPDGKQWHGRMISPTGKKKVYGKYRAVWKPEQCRRVACEGKHKYAMGLDTEARKLLSRLSKPYPKRERSSEIGTSVPTEGEAETLSVRSNLKVENGPAN